MNTHEMKDNIDYKTTVTASIELTVYEWHTLLSELEYAQRFVNRDGSNAKSLWHKIVNKLNNSIVSD